MADKDKSNAIAQGFLERWEGCRLTSYKNFPSEPWTIGYGHTGPDVKPGMTISWHEAKSLLLQDMERFIRAVDSKVTVPLNENQRAALISFAFNVGVGAFSDSTLLRRLNAGEYDAVPSELRRWNKAGGEVVQGLINRRHAEGQLWLKSAGPAPSPTPPDAAPPEPPDEPTAPVERSGFLNRLLRFLGLA